MVNTESIQAATIAHVAPVTPTSAGRAPGSSMRRCQIAHQISHVLRPTEIRNKPSLTAHAVLGQRQAGVSRGCRVTTRSFVTPSEVAIRARCNEQGVRPRASAGNSWPTRAAVTHLALGEIELRMGNETGVVNGGDGRLLDEDLGQMQS